jgi:general secretion pathway protein E
VTSARAAGTPALLDLVPPAWARRHGVLPLAWTRERVDVAVADAGALGALDDLTFVYRTPVRPRAMAPEALAAALGRAYAASRERASAAVDAVDGTDLATLRHELAERPDLLDATDDAPVIRLVNALLADAVEANASDLHVEPTEAVARIRVRVDGLLRDVLTPPRRHLPAIVARIKILARLDVAERRLPQDGRFGIRVGDRVVDVRVSVVPTAFGERAVLRLLERSRDVADLPALGFDAAAVRTLSRFLARSHGIVLVTGPTGSGKTTTLYAALQRVASPERNVLTIEDPVEYELPGVGQMQVNPRIGLDFGTGLRAILRQDPDVILVGEIRDRETVRIALQAALTGHLVFATLHTNDAPSAVTRLLEMEVEPHLIASTLRGVVAQRLVRRSCDACGGDGCTRCGEVGLRGRTAVYELFEPSPALCALVLARADATRIRALAISEGMRTMRECGDALVRAGTTSAAELDRVLGEDA